MRRFAHILLLMAILACEEVVVVDIPPAQNLIVVEGWVTDSLTNHPVRITQTNAFDSENDVPIVENATVLVQSRSGDLFRYSYQSDGRYIAEADYRGVPGQQYRVLIEIDTLRIRSDWDLMPRKIEIMGLTVDSFEDTDPVNNNNEITIYYPKLEVLDPVNELNYYRWQFSKNGTILTNPESITLQDDRLFNGNLIPNNFQDFEYRLGDEMEVTLFSISARTHDYLSLLKSQITNLGTSSATTPSVVRGNLHELTVEDMQILGYFGALSSSSKRAVVE